MVVESKKAVLVAGSWGLGAGPAQGEAMVLAWWMWAVSQKTTMRRGHYGTAMEWVETRGRVTISQYRQKQERGENYSCFQTALTLADTSDCWPSVTVASASLRSSCLRDQN